MNMYFLFYFRHQIYLVSLYAFTSAHFSHLIFGKPLDIFHSLVYYSGQLRMQTEYQLQSSGISSKTTLIQDLLKGFSHLLCYLTRSFFILHSSDRLCSGVTNDWREISLWWTECQIFRMKKAVLRTFCCFMRYSGCCCWKKHKSLLEKAHWHHSIFEY